MPNFLIIRQTFLYVQPTIPGSIPSLAAGVGAGCVAGFGAVTSNYYILLGKLLAAFKEILFFESS